MKKTLFVILCALFILPLAVSCKKEKKQASLNIKDTTWTGTFDGIDWRLSFDSNGNESLEKIFFNKVEESFYGTYSTKGKEILFGDKLKCVISISYEGNSGQLEFHFVKGVLKGKNLDVTINTTALNSTGYLGTPEGIRIVSFTKIE